MAHKVQVNVNNTNLPNGFVYQAGNTVVLTDEEFAKIVPSAFTLSIAGTTASNGNPGNGNGIAVNSSAYTITDLGVVVVGTAQVTTQGNAVTLTSAAVSTTGSGTELTDYNTLAVAVNKLVADVLALNTNLSGTGKALV